MDFMVRDKNSLIPIEVKANKLLKIYYKSLDSLIALVAERRARLSPREEKKAARIPKSSALN